MLLIMLSYEQAKAIENALGADKAWPIIRAFESLDNRDRADLVTTGHLDDRVAEVKSYVEARVAEVKDYVEARVAEVKSYVDTRLAETKVELIKWVAGMLVAQAALVATLVKLL